MTNQVFKCTLKNELSYVDFYDPGMTLLTLSQDEKHKPPIYKPAFAFKPVVVNPVLYPKRAPKRASHCSKVTKLTFNTLLHPKRAYKTSTKKEGYIALQFSAVSKESNSKSLDLLNALNLNISELMIESTFNKKFLGCHSFETYKSQQHQSLDRHSGSFAQNLNKRYVPKHNQHKTESGVRFTVIRSPFVFKKSREQFVLTRKTCFVKLALTKTQQHIYAQHLTATKFPSELQCTFVN